MYLKDSIQYTTSQVRKLNPQVSIPDGADLTDIGYYLIEPVAAPTPNPGERVTAGDPEEYAPGQWRETWAVIAIPVSEVKTQRLNELTAIRYQHETAGIALNGATIKTDLDSQAKINGAWSAAQMDPAILIDWKAETGWIQIDAATISGIAMAVASHVQACFSNERVLSTAIAAATTIEALNAVDLTVGWSA